jgi:PII-like signaling protein
MSVESTPAQALMVRVYLSESDHALVPLMRLLHDELGVCGATVVRGIEGFGASGKVHAAALLELSLDLPLIVEFFDCPDKARAAIARITQIVKPGHVVSWPVTVEVGATEC